MNGACACFTRYQSKAKASNSTALRTTLFWRKESIHKDNASMRLGSSAIMPDALEDLCIISTSVHELISSGS